MKVTAEQVLAFAKQLAALASIYNPASAATVSAFVAAGVELNSMIQSIRENDPDMWAKVSSETNSVVAQYEAGLPSA
jgi:hypothetical protein